MTFKRAYSLVTVQRSVTVGLLATSADYLLLIALVERIHLRPTIATLPALVLGSGLQFLGSRYYTFAIDNLGRARQQIIQWIICEGVSFSLNALGFYTVYTQFPLPYLMAKLVVSTLVFLLFSLPAWATIFNPYSRSLS